MQLNAIETIFVTLLGKGRALALNEVETSVFELKKNITILYTELIVYKNPLLSNHYPFPLLTALSSYKAYSNMP
jgi:hypothetical protein